MKKVLSTIAALGLVAGLATSAAALELKVKGDYTVDGFYLSDGNGAAATPGHIDGGQGLALAGDDTESDSWLQHMFNIEAEMVVNDKISMKSRIRLIDWGTVWGSQDDTDIQNGDNNNKNMSIERLWMVYKSPLGTWEIGRRSAGAWGLSFVDKANAGDRIFWGSDKLMGENVSAYVFYQKLTEYDAYTAEDNDQDSDYYELGATLKDGWGKATLAYGGTFDTTHHIPGSSDGYQNTTHRVKGVGQFKIGANMGFDTEFDYKFGKKEFHDDSADVDTKQLAFIADLSGTMDALTGHAMYFHISGDDNGTSDGDSESYGGTGSDFEPLYILTGVFGNILNQDQGASTYGSRARTAGADAFALTADFAATQDLTLHAGFGYAQADKEMDGYDNDYGFEYNAGAAYKLQDNLIYAVHLGYLATGDFFQLGDSAVDTNDIFLASHHLTMSF
jgi:hypothetical protein